MEPIESYPAKTSIDKVEFTPEEVIDFNEKFDAWFAARGVYNALQSQGRHCPPIALARAAAASKAASEAYTSTRIYRYRLAEDKHKAGANMVMYRLAAMIRQFRRRHPS